MGNSSDRRHTQVKCTSIFLIVIVAIVSLGCKSITAINGVDNQNNVENQSELPNTDENGENNEGKINSEENTALTEEAPVSSAAFEIGLERVEEYGGDLLDSSILFYVIDKESNNLIFYRSVIIEDDNDLVGLAVPEVTHHLPEWSEDVVENMIFAPTLMYTEDFIVYSIFLDSAEGDQVLINRYDWNERTEETLLTIEGGADSLTIPALLPESDYLLVYSFLFAIGEGSKYYDLATDEWFELPAPEGWESGIIEGYLPETNSFIVTTNQNDQDQKSCWIYNIESGFYEFLFDGWMESVSPDNRLIIYTAEEPWASEVHYRIFDISERMDIVSLELPDHTGEIAWAGSSDQISFKKYISNATSELWLMNINDQSSQMVIDFSGIAYYWSNDGRYLVYESDQWSGDWTILDSESGYYGYIYTYNDYDDNDYDDNDLEFFRWE